MTRKQKKYKGAIKEPVHRATALRGAGRRQPQPDWGTDCPGTALLCPGCAHGAPRARGTPSAERPVRCGRAHLLLNFCKWEGKITALLDAPSSCTHRRTPADTHMHAHTHTHTHADTHSARSPSAQPHSPSSAVPPAPHSGPVRFPAPPAVRH